MHRNALLEKTRARMGGFFSANQVLGRRLTTGCVAIEITQRCNLDCSLCYLSESSESVLDIPMEEIYRRLDAVVQYYGTGTHVQITGGDPTLRKHAELIEIVRYASEIGLYPALFTNGIAAGRKLLANLAAAGLRDVAFHVDTTQRRPGYNSEIALNTVREEYLELARGLGLMVIFNTTVHRGNFDELPDLVRFFVAHADVIGLVSFQLQAETGRGEWGSRDSLINQETVRAQINTAAGSDLPWDLVRVGHPDCHSYLPAFVLNNRIYPAIEDPELFNRFLQDFQNVRANRHSRPPLLAAAWLQALLLRPAWWPRLTRYLLVQLRRTGKDLIHGHCRIRKLSFFIQNFMDADKLVRERVEACSFMVMTADGPVSMCAHNARRDEYILKPVRVTRADGTTYHFKPLRQGEKARGRATA